MNNDHDVTKYIYTSSDHNYHRCVDQFFFQVGDTPADTIMGQAANLGLTIGVLTGVGAHRDLVDADIIVQVILKSRGVYKQNTRYGYRLYDFIYGESVEMTDVLQ